MGSITTTDGLVPNWFPPNRENYDRIVFLWKLYPLVASLQWLVSWYGMGKTSVPSSRLNIPGRIAWFTMEIPGVLTLLYNMRALAAQVPAGEDGLPYQNKVLAALFVLHYAYRAVLYPLLQPSMSPIHALVWALAAAFQVANGVALGGWLGAYGPTTQADWRARQHGPWSPGQFALGLAVFYVGLAGNYYHDEELREIRRRAGRRAAAAAAKDGASREAAPGQAPKRNPVDKHYELPNAGLFRVVLYPHYLLEWVEWFGFWMAAGWGCVPARCFVLNEVFSMLPRAVRGRKWYAERFGEDKIRGRWAVIPGVV
ncbi:hypothetical protein VTJ83DRAFT_6400 [Remersonia thermophila]|uniref:3-oxo-5-alpha-steroid 4-dehydrogenase C-terminal domain-containing protein n=1 Tax=Remersonia thermophila TaxID=72144 RepID=A0ABR4D4K2_9PEZI